MITIRHFGFFTSLALALMLGSACGSVDDTQVDESESEIVRRLCAGPGNLQCGRGEYCAALDVGKCPSSTQLGSCATRPVICTREYRPVCGCDGTTYGNACSAAAAGVAVVSTGECPVICGGIAGLPCPAGSSCVDNPSDSCNPATGGVDCSGICVARPRL